MDIGLSKPSKKLPIRAESLGMMGVECIETA